MESDNLDEYYDYDNILNRMLSNISDDIDKREGSVIYNALAPAALELAQMYFTLKNNMDLCFADTAVGEYLDRICEQIGIKRKEATKAVRRAQFFKINTEDEGEKYLPYENIQIGSRFSIEDVTYKVIEKIDTTGQEQNLKNVYKLECEIAGIKGNEYLGNLIPIDYIEDIAKAELNAIIIPGTDEETDEELRNRYYEYVKNTAFGGNIQDYKNKTKEIDGVGLVYVTTADEIVTFEENVRLTILNSNLEIANNQLVADVQKIIDPTQNGEGIGIAPIGHIVKVKTAEKWILNVTTTLTLKEGLTVDSIKNEILDIIKQYYKDVISKEWETSKWTIRISQIENRILNIDGVIDISNTKLTTASGTPYNGNCEYHSGFIPVIEEVTINVN